METELEAFLDSKNRVCESFDRFAHVWFSTPVRKSDFSDWSRLEACLSEEEVERKNRFIFYEDQDAYVTAHALLRFCLSIYSKILPDQWRFQCESGGRTQIDSKQNFLDLQFSLSHTKKMVGCLIAKGTDCGFDIEKVGRIADPLGFAKQFFTPNEVSILAALTDIEQSVLFTQLWSLKEAYLKAKGIGLRIPLNCFGFEIESTNHEIIFYPPANDVSSNYQFCLHELPNHHWAAIAIKRNDTKNKRLIFQKWDFPDMQSKNRRISSWITG